MEGQLLNGENVARNHRVTGLVRMSVSSFVGCAAGVVGCSWYSGFAMFAVFAAMLTVMLLGKARTDLPGVGKGWASALESRRAFTIEGLVQGFLSFLLFWALLYNLVHIY